MKAGIWGYALGAVAAACYGMNPLFALPLMSAGIGADGVLLLRYLFALPLLAAIMLCRGRGFGLRPGQWLPLILMGLIMAGSSLTLFNAYGSIGAGIASTLLFVYPILTAVIMTVIYHERVKVSMAVCVLLALSGIALLYKGGDGQALAPGGVITVFLSALLYAVYLVMCSRPALKVIPTLKLTFYVIAFGTLLFIPTFDLRYFELLDARPALWLDVFALALFPTALSLLATSAAIQKVGSTPVAILGAMEPVTAVAIATALFGEPMTARLAAGMGLVILSVTVVIAGENVSGAVLRVRKMFPRIRRGGVHLWSTSSSSSSKSK